MSEPEPPAKSERWTLTTKHGRVLWRCGCLHSQCRCMGHGESTTRLPHECPRCRERAKLDRVSRSMGGGSLS